MKSRTKHLVYVTAIFLSTAFFVASLSLINSIFPEQVDDTLNHGTWFSIGNNTYVGIVEKGTFENVSGTTPVIKYSVVFLSKDKTAGTIVFVSHYEKKKLFLETNLHRNGYYIATGTLTINGKSRK